MFDGNNYKCDGNDYIKIRGTNRLREKHCKSNAKWSIHTKYNWLHFCDNHKDDKIQKAPFAEWQEIIK